jgi:hypothetical protein
MSMLQIEDQIHELIQAGNEQVEEHAKCAREAAAAEHLFKRARAKLLMQARQHFAGERSSEADREAWGMEQPTGARNDDGSPEVLADLDWAYRETAAVRDACVERGRMIRAQLSAAQTLASNVRSSVAHATGTGG